MKKLGTATLRITDLVGLPDDMQQRMESEPVGLLAKSLKSVGLLERIMVRDSDSRIVSGRDRVAAHLLNGEKEIEVEFVECSDQVVVEADLVSNAARRHSQKERDAAIVQLTDLWTAEEAANPPDMSDAGPGRRTTPKGRAERRVAAATGKPLQAVKRARSREEKRNAPTVVKPKAKKKPKLITLGLPVDDAFLAKCEAVTKFTADAVSKVRSSMTGITQLLNAELPCYVGDLERVRAQLQSQVAELQSLAPHSVCPYCKNVQGFVADCDACEGKGWVGSRGYDSVPADLLVEGEGALIVASTGDEWGLQEAIEHGEDWMPE